MVLHRADCNSYFCVIYQGTIPLLLVFLSAWFFCSMCTRIFRLYSGWLSYDCPREFLIHPTLIVFQLVLSWHMKAATMCEFSRQEFVGGLQSLGWVYLMAKQSCSNHVYMKSSHISWAEFCNAGLILLKSWSTFFQPYVQR